MSKKEKLGELITDNKENAEKLSAADIKAASEKNKIEKKISKLILANKENALTLSSAYKIINTQKKEIKKQAADLIRADKENAKRKADLISAKKELAHKAKLIILNKELTIQITERKQAEEALRDSNIFSESLLKTIPFGMDIVDEKGTVIFQSDNLKRILGKDVLGKKCWDIIHDDKKQNINCPLIKGIVIGETNTYESHGVFSDKIVEIIHTGMFYKGKKAMLEVFQDITERKQAEESLVQSEKKFRDMTELLPLCVFETNLEGKLTFANKTAFESFGYSISDFQKGINIFQTLVPDDRERAMKNVQNSLKGVIQSSNEYLLLRKDGSSFPALIQTNAVIEYDKPVGVRGFIIDITERKHSEEKLQNNENFLKETQVIANLGTYSMDVASGKWASSEVLDKIFGIESDYDKSVEGWASVIHPEWQKIMTDYFINEVIGNKTKFDKEYKIIRNSDKEERWVHGIGNLKFNGNEQPVTMIGTIQDITERKKAEEEIITAKEKAEESDRLKSAFLSNMSHEIRTPMNGILGFIELLKEPNLSSDDQQDYIQTIQISGARMLNTINSIVDMSKIESGLITLDIKETDLNEKLEFTYKFFKPEVETKGLKYSYKNGLPTNKAIVKTDNEKVYAILTNLVRNAIKFTFDGSIEFGYEKKGEYLEFFVKDTGIGIPQNQQQLIFERFRQGSELHNRGYEGSGLGLSISKSYIEMLGGRIWVESEEGKGSTFYFTLPYNNASEENKEILSAISSEHKESQLKNLKSLIVEDDELSHSLLTITIQKISKKVLHAITGEEAIEVCRNNPDLDLVLMDIRMPLMDGLEATRQIRQFNKDVIIIAQTAYAFAGDSEKAIEAGCNDYISKPINMTALFELIKKHVNK